MRHTCILAFFLSIQTGISAQDTFSIVAVDPISGEIGSAGASCLDDSDISGGVTIISDLIPGIGAIHTQSYWLYSNQINAHEKMLEGLSPQEIIDWLIANDVQGNPEIRQYGIVDFVTAEPRSAAFTGVNCFDVKEHKTGANYAIQGNILLNDDIIDGMETAFLNTEGSLAERLMATLQAANIPGADSRCLEEGVSSQSAFLRVARPNDDINSLYLDIEVLQTLYGVEPIDSLQVLFDEWQANSMEYSDQKPITIFPNPANSEINISGLNPGKYHFEIKDLRGSVILKGDLLSSSKIQVEELHSSIVVISIYDENSAIIIRRKLIIE